MPHINFYDKNYMIMTSLNLVCILHQQRLPYSIDIHVGAITRNSLEGLCQVHDEEYNQSKGNSGPKGKDNCRIGRNVVNFMYMYLA
jgi:hypothetical protein